MSQNLNSGLRVLVIEDDDSIRNILNDMLSLENHAVTLAADGEKALKYLQKKDYDLIITDLGLPGISGLELAQKARRFQQNISIISISSWQGKETENKARECGIDISIWKPFKFGQILDAVHQLTGRTVKKSVQ